MSYEKKYTAGEVLLKGFVTLLSFTTILTEILFFSVLPPLIGDTGRGRCSASIWLISLVFYAGIGIVVLLIGTFLLSARHGDIWEEDYSGYPAIGWILIFTQVVPLIMVLIPTIWVNAGDKDLHRKMEQIHAQHLDEVRFETKEHRVDPAPFREKVAELTRIRNQRWSKSPFTVVYSDWREGTPEFPGESSILTYTTVCILW